MKKVMIAVGISLLTGSLYAACMGPFCWDDQGQYVGGLITDGNGDQIPVASSSTIANAIPRGTGQLIICNTCKAASNSGFQLCVSTETTTSQNAYVIFGSTAATANVPCK